MSNVPTKFTMGVEEEYLLVDRETRALVVDPPDTLMKACEEKLGGQVSSELLRSQIEIGTAVCNNVGEAREDLRRLRKLSMLQTIMALRRLRPPRIHSAAG